MLTIKGLRTQETRKFEAFFRIVQEFANKRNCTFFLEAGDTREFETEKLEGEDLQGWLIPISKEKEFESIWLEDNVTEEWDDFFCFAVWENENNPIIKFTI